MRLSFSTLGCPDWSIADIARRAKEMGYDGVELRVADDGNHLSPDASPADLEAAVKAFSGAGIEVMGIGGYASFSAASPAETAENQALLRKNIAVAKTLKSTTIRAYAGRLPEGEPREPVIRRIVEALKPLADEAAHAGVRIGLETHDDWVVGENIMKLVSGIDSPAVGVVYDIFNGFVAGSEPWETTYAQIRPYIIHCHLKDGKRTADGGHRYTYLGEGDLPLKAIMARMKKDGFNGFWSFEWEKKWIPDLDPPEKVFPHFARTARTTWDSV